MGCATGDTEDAPRTTSTPTPPSTATPTPPPSTTPARPPYTRWLPAPGTLSTAERYGFTTVDVAAIARFRGSPPTGLQQNHIDAWQPVSLPRQRVSLSLYFRRGFVVRGEYDRAAVIDRITHNGAWRRATSYAGYEILLRNDERRAVGITPDTILVRSAFETGPPLVDAIKVVIDTRAGHRFRYVVASPGVRAVVTTFSDPTILTWRPVEKPESAAPTKGRFAGQIGLVRWGQYNSDGTVDVKIAVVYTSASAVDPEALRTYYTVGQNG